MTSQGLFKADLLLQESRSIGPVLGLETGAPQASIAICSRGSILAAETHERRAHGESVAGAVRSMLERCGLALSDLDAIAVGIGPGSFTGLRIALSYAKGVALATGCALIGIPSLDALALCALELAGLPPEAAICPILDARKGEMYAALYRRVDNGVEKISGEFLAGPGELAARFEHATVCLGDGGQGDALRAAAGPGRVVIAVPAAAPPPAAMLAALGAARMARGQAGAADSVAPLYVRPSEAELKSKPPAPAAGLEALWSREKKSSSVNMRTTTRN